MIVRPVEAKDLRGLAEIERRNMPAPWTEGQLAAELGAKNGLGFVAAEKEGLCGFVFFRLCPPEGELLHLLVAHAVRGQGIGYALLARGLETLIRQGCISCFLEVRRSNQSALHLYQRAGFRQAGVRKNYYSQPVEDALLLQKKLEEQGG